MENYPSLSIYQSISLSLDDCTGHAPTQTAAAAGPSQHKLLNRQARKFKDLSRFQAAQKIPKVHRTFRYHTQHDFCYPPCIVPRSLCLCGLLGP